MQVVSEQDAKQADAIEQLEDSFSSRVLGKYGLEKTISLCLLRSCQQKACIELLESLLCSEQAECTRRDSGAEVRAGGDLQGHRTPSTLVAKNARRVIPGT